MVASGENNESSSSGVNFSSNANVGLPTTATPTFAPLNNVTIGVYAVSIVALVVTVVVQVANKRNNRNSKILTCHAFSLIIWYSTMSVRNFFVQADRSPHLCYGFFIFMYYFMVSSMLWMSVMSYNVWLFLSEIQPPPMWMWQCHKRKHQFLHYSVVVWGIPLMLLAVILMIDQNCRLQLALNLHPEIATVCWFPGRPCNWIFVHGPLLAVSAFNFTFFVLIVTLLARANRISIIVINQSRDRQLLSIYVKLFAIMEMCWLAAAIVFAVNNRSMDHGSKTDRGWIALLIFGFQGIAIFIAYFCKRSTFDFLKEKLCHTT